MSFTESLTSLCSNVFHITGPHFRWLFSIENSGAVLELDDPPWTLAQLAGDCSVTDSKILSGKFQPISLQFIPGFWCQVIWLAEKRFVLPALFAFLQSKAAVTWELGDYQAGGALSEGSHSKSAFSPPAALHSLLSGDWIKISVGVPDKTRLATFHKLRGNQKIFPTHHGGYWTNGCAVRRKISRDSAMRSQPSLVSRLAVITRGASQINSFNSWKLKILTD